MSDWVERRVPRHGPVMVKLTNGEWVPEVQTRDVRLVVSEDGWAVFDPVDEEEE